MLQPVRRPDQAHQHRQVRLGDERFHRCRLGAVPERSEGLRSGRVPGDLPEVSGRLLCRLIQFTLGHVHKYFVQNAQDEFASARRRREACRGTLTDEGAKPEVSRSGALRQTGLAESKIQASHRQRSDGGFRQAECMNNLCTVPYAFLPLSPLWGRKAPRSTETATGRKGI